MRENNFFCIYGFFNVLRYIKGGRKSTARLLVSLDQKYNSMTSGFLNNSQNVKSATNVNFMFMITKYKTLHTEGNAEEVIAKIKNL